MPKRALVVMFAGTRDLPWPKIRELILGIIADLPDGTVVLHGGNGNVDRGVHQAARARGLVTGVFEANWLKHGLGGGPIRTLAMVQLSDRAYVIWNGKSPGSKRAVEYAKRHERELIEHVIEPEPT